MTLAITEELGRFEEFFSDVVYPVWPLWLVGCILLTGVALYMAFRMGWLAVASRHPLISGGVLAVILAVSVPAGWYTISPLFERETVCEASPIAGAGVGSEKCDDVAVAAGAMPTQAPEATGRPTSTSAPETPPEPTAASLEPRVIREGEFEGADDFHFGRGKALLIETAPSTYVLRFEEFSVRNGPSLFVYLSPDPNGYGDGSLELGELKGTDGAFNYEVPPGTDVSQLRSAVVWCKAFAVLFATATLA